MNLGVELSYDQYPVKRDVLMLSCHQICCWEMAMAYFSTSIDLATLY
jgi:hypothetical protein